MDDKTPPTNPSPPAPRSADALRDVHARARAAMAAQRERMAKLESQLTQQLDEIATAVADQLSSDSLVAGEVERSTAEADALRQQLAEATAAWDAERLQLIADLASRTQLLDERLAEIDGQSAQLSTARNELNSRQQVLDDRMSQLNAQDRELRRRQEDLDADAQRTAALQSSLSETQHGIEQLRADLMTREAEVQSRDAQLERDRAALDAREPSWQADIAAITSERDELAAKLARLKQEHLSTDSELSAQLASAHEQFEQSQAAWNVERNGLEKDRTAHAKERATWDEERARWESQRFTLENQLLAATQQRDELLTNLNQLSNQTNQIPDLREQLDTQLADFQQQFADQQDAWRVERAAIEGECRAAEQKRDELADALATALSQLEAARGLSVAASERDELQQKFELVLSDVHRLRSRTAELEQELSSRPAADAGESVELVHLRGERDALAARVAELEQLPAATVTDADTAQEIADLQRRFELAVEDVRDLKRKNSQLEAQLVESKSRPVAPIAPTSTGGSSWEALKQKMLDSLDDESDDRDERRERERTSIADTIRITDEVVAAKDREIAELRAQLAEDGARVLVEDDSVRELVDNDTIIQQHRQRIAQIEREMEDKLRAAELEMSIERAKIAREQVQLADLRAEIDSVRGTPGTGTSAAIGQPKRRWLSKLGLGADEE